jgi:L-amino acid N-acyltransferase YncA
LNAGSSRNCTTADAVALCDIYNHYIRETVVTFEETPVTRDEMSRRIEAVTAHLPWIVWERSGSVVGYAYATTWKARSAYRFSVETTVYLAPAVVGRGIGRALYRELIVRLRALGMHCAIGGIALPNAGSVALHERMGFRKVAQFDEVGFKQGRWVDVGYWQLMLGPAP